MQVAGSSITNSVFFSPDCKHIATINGLTVMIWDVETGKIIHTMLHNEQVNDVLFSPKDKQILTVDSDNKIYIWNVETGELIHTTLIRDSEGIPRSRFCTNGEKALTIIDDSTATIWDVETGKLIHSLTPNFSNFT